MASKAVMLPPSYVYFMPPALFEDLIRDLPLLSRYRLSFDTIFDVHENHVWVPLVHFLQLMRIVGGLP